MIGDDNNLNKINIKSNMGHRGKHNFEELSKKIIGAAIEVHRELGPGFLESIYEEALKVEFMEHGLHYDAQKEIQIKYLSVEVGLHRLDLLVEKQIVVELKVLKQLTFVNFAKLLSYKKATGLKVGLLFNFAKPTLEIKRVVN
jgi:GxxExxY protein